MKQYVVEMAFANVQRAIFAVLYFGFGLPFPFLCASCVRSAGTTSTPISVARPMRLQEMLDSEISANSKFDNVFQLLNNSSQACTLSIKKKSCGCLRIHRDAIEWQNGAPFVLGPHQTSSITLDVQSGAPAPQAAREVLIAASDKSNSESIVRLSYTLGVRRSLVISPNAVIFDPIRNRRQELRITRRLRSKSFPEIPNPRFERLPPYVNLVALEGGAIAKIGMGGIWEASWSARLELDTSKYQESMYGSRILIAIAQDGFGMVGSARESFALVVRAGRGVSAPQSVHFGATQVGQAVLRRVYLRSTDGQRFKIASAKSTATSFRICDSGDHEASQNATLNLEFLAEVDGSSKGFLEIRTTHPAAPSLRIRLEGLTTSDNPARVVKDQ